MIMLISLRKLCKNEGKYSGDIRTRVQFPASLSPIVIPWEATIGTWENGFLIADIYWAPPNAEIGYT